MYLRKIVFSALISSAVIISACNRERVNEAADRVADQTKQTVDKAQEQFGDIAVPIGKQQPTREELERERFNAEWRRMQSFRAAAASKKTVPAPPAAQVTFVADPKFQEKLQGATFDRVDELPLRVPIKGDVAGPSVIRTQVLLDRARFSVGAIDGRWGKNSEIAVYWFQQENGIEPTGDVDESTFGMLMQRGGQLPTLVQHTVTEKEVAGPYTTIPEDVYEKEKLDCLCYESLAENLAEQYHATGELLALLNPGVDLKALRAGDKVTVPNVRRGNASSSVKDLAKVTVSVKGWYLHGLATDGSILFHAPTTLGSDYDPSPNETLKIVGIAHDPHFHYQPKLFYEVDDDEAEANLNPGPNSPVGVVWMALSKPHYGIHGTSDPETIGYTTSHGCVRLTNWDARELATRLVKGVQVAFVDTRKEQPANE